MTYLPLINQLLAIATIGWQVAILVFVIFFVLIKKNRKFIYKINDAYFLWFAFLISLFSMLLSLFYSDIALYTPCLLCWYQRIFMYPQVFILGLAIYKKDATVAGYSIILAAIGALIALYQVYLQFGGESFGTCSVVGSTVSCTAKYVLEFGYVTIPVMSLTTFLLILVSMLSLKKKNKLKTYENQLLS